MLQSKLFYKTSRDIPADAEAISHKLLLRAGFIEQVMAGVYAFLPLGLRVMHNIENIVRKNMEEIKGQELLLPALAPKENWQKTGRWDNFDALFKLKGISEKEYALGATHEEIISPIAKSIISSYKDLPLYLFQIQTKFRNEARAKSGILRTREFLMKDLYSFHSDEKDLDSYYEKVIKSYFKIYKECGITAYKTWASGGSFSKYSHEFQTITDSGEDVVFICKKCKSGINKEIKGELAKCPNCGATEFEEKKAVEVGNIFKLGTKYSEPFDLKFKDKDGTEKPVIMGCYGLGLGRLMGAVVEVNNDDKGIIWPKSIAPYDIHLICLNGGKKECDRIYKNLNGKINILYDDRQEKAAGEKFADADLIGIPIRIVISERTLEKKSMEVKMRNSKSAKLIKLNSKIEKLI